MGACVIKSCWQADLLYFGPWRPDTVSCNHPHPHSPLSTTGSKGPPICCRACPSVWGGGGEGESLAICFLLEDMSSELSCMRRVGNCSSYKIRDFSPGKPHSKSNNIWPWQRHIIATFDFSCFVLISLQSLLWSARLAMWVQWEVTALVFMFGYRATLGLDMLRTAVSADLYFVPGKQCTAGTTYRYKKSSGTSANRHSSILCVLVLSRLDYPFLYHDILVCSWFESFTFRSFLLSNIHLLGHLMFWITHGLDQLLTILTIVHALDNSYFGSFTLCSIYYVLERSCFGSVAFELGQSCLGSFTLVPFLTF